MERTRHRVFDLDLETDFPFRTQLQPGFGEPDLAFNVMESGPEAPGQCETLVYSSALLDAKGSPLVELWRQGERERLHFVDRADFTLEPDLIRYSAGADPGVVEGLFLSTILGYWMECRGTLALHGSAVVVDGAGAALVAAAGTGKSSLAAAFVTAGHRLLTDDVLALDHDDAGFSVLPSYPGIKLNPDVGGRLMESEFGWSDRVHPAHEKRYLVLEPADASFCATPQRLDSVFLLRREARVDGAARFLRVVGSEAVVELLEASFTPNLVEAAGLSAVRLERLVQLVEQVQVRYLVYESGFGRLPEIVEAVARELADS